jgi:hypothetical protein
MPPIRTPRSWTRAPFVLKDRAGAGTDPSFALHSPIHHPVWARASSGWMYRCDACGDPSLPMGVPVPRKGPSFATDPCPRRPEGRPRRWEGRTHAAASVTASLGGT